MRVWTIGHSNHPWLEFVALLRRTGITALADVRSTPRSRFAQFNARLKPFLVQYQLLGIHYYNETNPAGSLREARQLPYAAPSLSLSRH